ncbi:MAG: helix-turn-helix domain-containing protein [Myxococcales bacterium]|nr:helix-turn-helix domain-containing protein [Myxococcales bacterium]MCB9692770.1 helix-turn-helix domain-containing protein [Alphaproteobacteria bacterium]
MLTLLLTVPDASRLIAARVREARKRQGLTQAELAERALVGVATVQRLEQSGTGQITTFLRVLSALGHLRDVESLLQQPEPRTLAELRERR